MSIDSLIAVLPPPHQPVENIAADWSTISGELGVELPDDYRDFISVYGTGDVGSVIMPFNPFSQRRGCNLLEESLADGRFLWEQKVKYGPEGCPFPLFPEIGGLLAWGHSIDGDRLFWITEGLPNKWSVVVGSNPNMPEYYRYNLSMTEFLAQILTRKIRCPLFPKGFPPKRVTFNNSWV